MKQNIVHFAAILLLLVAGACAPLSRFESRSKTSISIYAGANVGGITENTDMTVVPGAEAPPEAIVDAFSGATHTGVHAGVHVARRLGRMELETGLDYMYNYQSFNYIDAGNFYIGQRNLDVSQLMIPVTLNIPLLYSLLPSSDLRLKIGYLGQVNLVTVANTGILPDYSVNGWSGGLTAGLAAYPVHFGNGSKLGFYLDAYRGSQIYEDYYNQAGFEMPGSSFIKMGITYKFK
jgi:hypothetical protein